MIVDVRLLNFAVSRRLDIMQRAVLLKVKMLRGLILCCSCWNVKLWADFEGALLFD